MLAKVNPARLDSMLERTSTALDAAGPNERTGLDTGRRLILAEKESQALAGASPVRVSVDSAPRKRGVEQWER